MNSHWLPQFSLSYTLTYTDGQSNTREDELPLVAPVLSLLGVVSSPHRLCLEVYRFSRQSEIKAKIRFFFQILGRLAKSIHYPTFYSATFYHPFRCPSFSLFTHQEIRPTHWQSPVHTTALEVNGT